ncbi:MAG: xanthine dehydrogenase family protein molybdopterin-binding subunit [Chloroflexota bacterium]
MNVVGHKTARVDGFKLVTGQGVFVDDLAMPGMLYCSILHSPHAHARIRSIDTSEAEALPGVECVLTWKDVPRIPHTTAGQMHPEPSPYDTFILDNKVRFVGDRVAIVAADSEETAERARELIAVDYEILPAVLDPRQAMASGVVIHDEPEATGIEDASRNLAATVEATVGDPEEGFRQADLVVENEFTTCQQQQASLEPHVTITWLDENERLVVRTSTQVPFHARRVLAHALGVSVGSIRVIKPRIGGGFGGKQEVLIEMVPAIVTLKTRRPCRLWYTRQEELTAARSRHPMILRCKTGVKRDGSITANEMTVLSDTGAYGAHALTVPMVTGMAGMPFYRTPNIRYQMDAVYTNRPVAGAFRGYGNPQANWAREIHMEEVAQAIGMDSLEFRRKNHIRLGDPDPMSSALSEGVDPIPRVVNSCGLEECIERVLAETGYLEKRNAPTGDGPVKYGIGLSMNMHGTSIPGSDMGGAVCKANEDGTFTLLVGATDLGTGSDTVLAQMAAEVLGVTTNDITVYSSDTDVTPFDVGAYASSTTYVSGFAVRKAAEAVRSELLREAARLMECSAADLDAGGGRIFVKGSPERFRTVTEVSGAAMYGEEKRQITGAGSHVSDDSPPPFACQVVEVEVDTQTGFVRPLSVTCAVDLGKAINPQLAEGQIEGGLAQGLGYGLMEELVVRDGRVVNDSMADYRIFTANDMPRMKAILVETYEPNSPFGNKSVAEIPIEGVAPALANAVYNAVGVRIHDMPLTPERVLAALRSRAEDAGDGFADAG